MASSVDDVQSKIAEVLNNVIKCSIGSVTVGHSPLRRSKSVTISETDDGQWKCQEKFEEEGIIVYIAIKYKTDEKQNEEVDNLVQFPSIHSQTWTFRILEHQIYQWDC